MHRFVISRIVLRQKVNACQLFGTLSILGFLSIPATAQNLLVNGSFEAGTLVGTEARLSSGSTAITGWAVIDELAWLAQGNPYGSSPSQGSKFLDLTGYTDAPPHGGVQQSVLLVAGNTYRLSFDVGYDSRFQTSPVAVTASITGFGSQTVTHTRTPNVPNNWQTFSIDFTATAANTTVSLRGADAAVGAHIGLDNALLIQTAAAAPEPGPLTLALIGFAFLGFPVQSRRLKKFRDGKVT